MTTTSTYHKLTLYFWSLGEEHLRDVYSDADYREMVLFLLIIKQLDSLLGKDIYHNETNISVVKFSKILGCNIKNTSKWTLRLLCNTQDLSYSLADNFIEYTEGFEERFDMLISKFSIKRQISYLNSQDNKLLTILEKIVSIDDNPEFKSLLYSSKYKLFPLPNLEICYIFREIVKKFNDDTTLEPLEKEKVEILLFPIFHLISRKLNLKTSIYESYLRTV